MKRTALSRNHASDSVARSARVDTEYSRRAQYHSPQRAQAFDFDLPEVPVHAFRAERLRALDSAAPTGWIDLDLSPAIGTAYPATTPTLLARYAVLHSGAALDAASVATTVAIAASEIVYVMTGEGFTRIDGQRIDWHAGDVLALPGCRNISHHAGPGGARLFVCSDAPAFRFLGVSTAKIDAEPVHYRAEDVAREMGVVLNRPEDARSWPVQLTQSTLQATHAVTPMMTAGFNPLEPGASQRAHRHNAAAVTLSLQGTGYSLIGDERVEWEPFLVSVTPPWLVHSHHNTGQDYMMNFTVQDAGLHFYARTMNFTLMPE